jgi:beta-lactamase class A
MPRSTVWKRVSLGAGIVLILVGSVGFWKRHALHDMAENWSELKQGSELVKTLNTSDDLLEYFKAHPQDVSIAAWTLGDEASGIYWNADARRPVTSLTRLWVLVTLAEQFESQALSPSETVSLDFWEQSALPVVDAGAHQVAVRDLQQSDRLENERVALADLAWVMMRFGAMSAADALMARLGRSSLETATKTHGGDSQDAPVPFAGEFIEWKNPSFTGSPDSAWSTSDKLRQDAGLRQSVREQLIERGLQIPIREQARMAQSTGRQGTARGYASLMARIYSNALPGNARIREALEWTMTEETTRQLYEVLGNTGGTLPGILASTSYGKPKGERPAKVTAVFIHRLPTAVWLHLLRTSLHQEFESRLIEDPAFFERVKQAWVPPARS